MLVALDRVPYKRDKDEAGEVLLPQSVRCVFLTDHLPSAVLEQPSIYVQHTYCCHRSIFSITSPVLICQLRSTWRTSPSVSDRHMQCQSRSEPSDVTQIAKQNNLKEMIGQNDELHICSAGFRVPHKGVLYSYMLHIIGFCRVR